MTPTPQRLPDWARKGSPLAPGARALRLLLRENALNTVCEEARCPNLGDCFSRGTATFMLLGDRCTRRCGYCSVATARPEPPDAGEPDRVADAAARLHLRYVVLTSVARDDLADGGATHFAAAVRAIRRRLPGARVEILVPDFRGRLERALDVLSAVPPDVMNHNLETVPRLYRVARSGSRYERSLGLLALAKQLSPKTVTKTGIMVGLGEEMDELLEVCRDLAARKVDILTIGQYLAPSRNHLPVKRLYPPEEFAWLRQEAMKMGFRHVESGPLVRSSYHAHEQAESILAG